MDIGPFRLNEMEQLKAICDKAGIACELFIDEELQAKTMSAFNEQATVNPRVMAGHLDLRIVFIAIEDGDFPKVKDELEKFGIAAPSDGSYELAED